MCASVCKCVCVCARVQVCVCVCVSVRCLSGIHTKQAHNPVLDVCKALWGLWTDICRESGRRLHYVTVWQASENICVVSDRKACFVFATGCYAEVLQILARILADIFRCLEIVSSYWYLPGMASASGCYLAKRSPSSVCPSGRPLATSTWRTDVWQTCPKKLLFLVEIKSQGSRPVTSIQSLCNCDKKQQQQKFEVKSWNQWAQHPPKVLFSHKPLTIYTLLFEFAVRQGRGNHSLISAC